MITVREAADRGKANFGWLDSRHSFSFGDYVDPAHMGFRALRVINDDRVKGGGGFGTHPHRDMEILSYVVEGAMEHKDSMGNGSVIRAGDVQLMTAGTGVTHSEFNHDKHEPVHFLQVWIQPARKGLPPGYQQQTLNASATENRLYPIATPDGRGGGLVIHQDVAVYTARLEPGHEITHRLQSGRGAWVQVLKGKALVNGHSLHAGSGLAAEEEPELNVTAEEPAEWLLFDLA